MEENRQNNVLKIFKSKAFVIICALVLVAAVLALGISAALNSNPLTQVSKAARNSGRALSKTDAYSDAYDFANNGSVGIYWHLQKFTEQLAGYGVDLGVSLKLYSDSKNNTYVMDVGASTKGEGIADARLYLDPTKIVATCEALFGDESYGAKLENFKENFENSVFGENGAYSLGLDEEHFEILENYKAQLETSQELEKDSQEIIKDFWAVLMKSVNENALVSKKAGSVEFTDQTVKTNDVVIRLEANAVIAVAEDVLEYLKDNEAIISYIEKYKDIFASSYGVDMDQVLAEYNSAIEGALESMRNVEIEEEDAWLEIVVGISKSKKELVGLNITVSGDGEEVKFSAICGPTWSNISEVNFTVENDEKVEISYLVKENTKKAFDAEFEIVQNEEQLAAITCTWDGETEEYNVLCNVEGEKIFGFEGAFKVDGKTKSLIFDSVEIDGQTVEIGGLIITVNTGDKVPSAKKYTDILTMDEGSVEEIISDIQSAIGELTTAFYSAIQ